MKVKDYILLEGHDIEELTKEVRTHMQEGWELYYAPYGFPDQEQGDWHFQAMVLPVLDPIAERIFQREQKEREKKQGKE